MVPDNGLVELVAVAVTVTVASPSPEDGLTDIPEPLAEAVQGLLALTCTVWAPPSAENARFSGVTVSTGSGSFGGECEVLWSDGQYRVRSGVASEEQGCQSTKQDGEEAFHKRLMV